MSKAGALRDDLRHAVERPDAACKRLAAEADEDSLVRDGMPQRFEFCFETARDREVMKMRPKEGVELMKFLFSRADEAASAAA